MSVHTVGKHAQVSTFAGEDNSLRCSSRGAAQIACAADESVTKISRHYAVPGREAEVEARFLKLVAFVRKAEPNVTYRLYRSMKDPSVFLFYEVYPSQAAREEHENVTTPAFRKGAGSTEGLFAPGRE